MTEHENPDPWADVSLPPPFDAREIYEYATSVGAQRRGQRRRRRLVLTFCGGLVVALTAAGIGLTGGDGGETSIQVATQASIPRAPARSKETAPAPQRPARASAPRKSAGPPAPPAPPSTSQCNALAGVTSSETATLTAFRKRKAADTTTTAPTPETTTTTTTTPPPPETTTTTSPPPPTTTPTTKRTTPTTRIAVSPDTVIAPPPADSGNVPVSPSPLVPRRRTRC
jgi:hypothetical protein